MTTTTAAHIVAGNWDRDCPICADCARTVLVGLVVLFRWAGINAARRALAFFRADFSRESVGRAALDHRLNPSMKATDFARHAIESQIHFPQPVQKCVAGFEHHAQLVPAGGELTLP
jgi:hypothetical protein